MRLLRENKHWGSLLLLVGLIALAGCQDEPSTGDPATEDPLAEAPPFGDVVISIPGMS